MDNLTIQFLAVIICFLLFLTVMKIVKFLWRKVIYKVLVFFRPELKNLYDFGKWLGSFFRNK